MNTFKIEKTLIIFLVIVGLLFAAKNAYYTINPGTTALHMRLGHIVSENKVAGAYFKIPFLDKIVYIDNRVQKTLIETTGLTKDLQYVAIGLAINYRVDDAMKLFTMVGEDYLNIVIDPFTHESMKAIVARYTAEDLIRLRNEACAALIPDLMKRLSGLNIALVDINFVHLDFSPDFIHAVEEKQIAEQTAKTAKNLTEKVREEQEQLKIRTDAEVYTIRAKAEAEAYSLKIQKDAATKELIELKKLDVLARAIKTWNGKLPKMLTGAVSGLFDMSKIS